MEMVERRVLARPAMSEALARYLRSKSLFPNILQISPYHRKIYGENFANSMILITPEIKKWSAQCSVVAWISKPCCAPKKRRGREAEEKEETQLGFRRDSLDSNAPPALTSYF
jgi:hypothetical protein